MPTDHWTSAIIGPRLAGWLNGNIEMYKMLLESSMTHHCDNASHCGRLAAYRQQRWYLGEDQTILPVLLPTLRCQ